MKKLEPKEILKKAREDSRYTQKGLAAVIAKEMKRSYSLRQYQRLEEGEFPKFKSEVVTTIDKILGTNLYDIIYDKSVPRELPTAKDKSIRKPKIDLDENTDGITFVPISAQAGYSNRLLDPVFSNSLEKLYIPGFPYRGDRFRVWEVEGNSMEPTFKEHFHVLTEWVEHSQWPQIKDYYAFVIVTEDAVMLKRVYKKSKTEWVMISDNEDLYPQWVLPVSQVKEVWIVKRKMDWEMAPPKRFEIKL